MAGGTIGKRQNNPLNIRVSVNKWLGKLPAQGAFERFETVEHGIRAGMVLVRTYMKKYGLNTLRGIIGRFAPPTENNTDSYIKYVSGQIGVTADTSLKFDSVTVRAVVRAMAKLESRMDLTDEQLIRAWQML